MTRLKITILLSMLSISLAACASGKTSSVGAGVGLGDGGAGPASGREIIRAFDGGILPKESFSQLSRKDRTRALLAEFRALENTKTGQSVAWQNPNGKYSGTTTPAQAYSVGSQNCRQYTHVAQINGSTVQASGAACRTPDGKWIPLK